MGRETLDFNQTPSANRVHISFFGRRNAGKSSLVNAVTGQNLAIVSDMKGTTTDPVSKAMELLPLGPVVITDTPGFDDSGDVGKMRVEKTMQVLRKTDVAVLVIDSTVGLSEDDLEMMMQFQDRKIPYIVVWNKADLVTEWPANCGSASRYHYPYVKTSTVTGKGIEGLKTKLAHAAKTVEVSRRLIGDLAGNGDVVILVTPIDESAPKGRLILPQVQTIRDLLDSRAVCMVCQTAELAGCLAALKEPPALVVTDSQVFDVVKDMVPENVPLTSFSILMARYKGILDTAVAGARFVTSLQDGDCVLISEGCTHHRQCEDIGTVKLPGWIEKFSGRKLKFDFTSGGEFPANGESLREYALVVHCGGCMLNEREMMHRMDFATECGVPFTNYGTLIAHINGILERSLEVFES
ncbi:MAG: [Firmicutes bacterium]|nr:[FeFe] hydrogenase H-cluster maturation GTPase HydF [Bacillota bacterium]